MNKALKIIFNVLIVVACLALLVSLILYGESVKYANREEPDPVANEVMVFEYKLKHWAYGEITNSYFTDRMGSMEAPAGMEQIYAMGDYANTAFLLRMYVEKGDEEKARECREKLNALKTELDKYVTDADGIDEVLGKYDAR